MVHWSLTLHDLIADKYRDAMVVEAGDEENVITRIEGDFIVMTNFPNGEFAGKGYQDVEGVGAKRYKAAYEHILDTKAAFDVDLALERDFDRVWKVSMDDQTIEGCRGVRRGKKMPLGSSGVEASELEKIAVSRAMPRGHILGLIVILAGCMGVFTIKLRTLR